MITTSSASLTIYGENHTASAVTAILGIEPTESAEKGDSRGPQHLMPNGQLTPARFYTTSYWSLQAPEDAAGEGDSFSSLLRLAKMVEGKAEALAALRPDYRTVIRYLGMSDSDQAGFVYPADVLAALGPLGCDLYGDIYLDTGAS